MEVTIRSAGFPVICDKRTGHKDQLVFPNAWTDVTKRYGFEDAGLLMKRRELLFPRFAVACDM